jgi:AcrR family transcriptional regulator
MTAACILLPVGAHRERVAPRRRSALAERKQSGKAEETRNRILDAALRLFRERGFDQTTMRDVAAEAGVATGAAYYYYRSKEELVMAFYLRTDEEAHEQFAEAIAAHKQLKQRIRAMFDIKFAQFADHRGLLTALLKAGVDPRTPLSPFGAETKEVRDRNIDWYARALEGSDVNVTRDLAGDVPRLLWMYHLGLIYFWVIDESPGQRRTQRLLDATLDLVVQLLKVSSLPLMGPVRKRALKVLRAVDEE